MIFQNLFKCIGVEVIAREQVDEFAEREAAQVVSLDDAVQLRVLVL